MLIGDFSLFLPGFSHPIVHPHHTHSSTPSYSPLTPPSIAALSTFGGRLLDECDTQELAASDGADKRQCRPPLTSPPPAAIEVPLSTRHDSTCYSSSASGKGSISASMSASMSGGEGWTAVCRS